MTAPALGALPGTPEATLSDQPRPAPVAPKPVVRQKVAPKASTQAPQTSLTPEEKAEKERLKKELGL